MNTKHYLYFLILSSTLLVACAEYSAKYKLHQLGYGFNNASLIEAIDKNDIQAVKLFIEANFELNPRDLSDSKLPIIRAVAKNSVEIARLLLDAGAEVNTNTEYEPITYAIAQCNKEMVEVLVSAGADVNKVDTYSKKTPLAYAKYNISAVSYKCSQVAKFIEQSGGR